MRRKWIHSLDEQIGQVEALEAHKDNSLLGQKIGQKSKNKWNDQKMLVQGS